MVVCSVLCEKCARSGWMDSLFCRMDIGFCRYLMFRIGFAVLCALVELSFVKEFRDFFFLHWMECFVLFTKSCGERVVSKKKYRNKKLKVYFKLSSVMRELKFMTKKRMYKYEQHHFSWNSRVWRRGERLLNNIKGFWDILGMRLSNCMITWVHFTLSSLLCWWWFWEGWAGGEGEVLWIFLLNIY